MFLGIDTSNYTSSVAIENDGNIIQQKKLLTVKKGEKGLRQSDAVFQHTINMPELFDKLDFANIQGVGVSTQPRRIEGSYMPCFMVGKAIAKAVGKTNNIPVYETSHQVGHILAALYSSNKLDLINDEFIAFHLSGGTTEVLLVNPSEEDIITVKLVASSSDLKAGQAIDRVGVMLGMTFPCGKELDALASTSTKEYKIKPSINGLDCSLSGVENKAKLMFDNNEKPEDIAKFVLTYISTSIDTMLDRVINQYGNLPIVFSGGVSSNSLLRRVINDKYKAYFAEPAFSCDNAAGIAIFAKLKQSREQI